MTPQRRRTLALITMAALLASVVALGTWRMARPAGRRQRSSSPLAAIDATGMRVDVPADPRRIVSLCTSATDTLIRLGLADRMAAIDDYGAVIPGAGGIARIGRAAALNREAALALAPDLAFVWWYQDDAARTLAEAGAAVVRLRCGRADDVPAMIDLVAHCAGAPEQGAALSASVRRFLEENERPATDGSRPTVYVELYGPYKTMGRDSYLDDLLTLAGAHNVAADAAGSVLLSPERLLTADPDAILYIDEFTDAARLARRSALHRLRAFGHRRVHPLSRYTLVAGAGLPESVDRLRRLIHEE